MYNLAEEMHHEGRLQARYTWLADGTKLAMVDGDGSGYAYIGSLVYRNAKGTLSLESCSFGAGRIAVSMVGVTKTTVPYYYLTDHLGSTRVVVDGAGKVLERNDYLPFGLRWNKSERPVSDNRYRFNGKEEQVVGEVGYIDYGARMYDPWLGRWLSPDPAMQLANPYVFCGNNPIVYIDKDGQFFWLVVGIGAAIGAYLGGSAANDNWNPFQWDWSAGKTWGGFFGGAIQGGIGGMAFAYGASVFTGHTLLSSNGLTTFGYSSRGISAIFSGAKVFATGASMINNFGNAMDIIRGNYLYESKSFGGMLLQGLSRSTWERIQQLAGYTYAHGRNGFFKGIEVFSYYGALVVNDYNDLDTKGMTLGNIINAYGVDDNDDQLLQHEYGHVIQSRRHGLFYGLWEAPASGINQSKYSDIHYRFSIERQANRYAKDFFGDLWNDNYKYPTY